MTKGKKVTLWLLALALVLSLGLAARPGPSPWAWVMGHGQGMMNLTPDQAGKLFDLKEKFRTDTASLRKGLMIKHLEMKALWKAENPDEKAILAKQKEINALRDQMSGEDGGLPAGSQEDRPQLALAAAWAWAMAAVWAWAGAAVWVPAAAWAWALEWRRLPAPPAK